MSFFYIQGKFCILIDKYGVSTRIDFPESVILNQEIIDDQKFLTFLATNFKKINLKDKKVKFILGTNVVYQKTISLTSVERESQIKSFLESVPLDPSKILSKIYNGKSSSVIFAINNSFIQAFVRAFELYKIDVLYACPLVAFGISKEIIDISDIKIITSREKIVAKVDFLGKSERSGIGRIFQLFFSK